MLTEELVFNVDEMLGIADDLRVGILNAVLYQDPTAPVAATAHYLCTDCALHPPGSQF